MFGRRRWPECCPLYWMGRIMAAGSIAFVAVSARCDGFGNPFLQGANDEGRDQAYDRHDDFVRRRGGSQDEHDAMVEEVWPTLPRHGRRGAQRDDDEILREIRELKRRVRALMAAERAQPGGVA